MQGKQGADRDRSCVAGDIGAVAKLKEANTGDTLAAKDRPMSSTGSTYPEPAIAFAIEPKAKGDEDKIGDAIHRMIEEDLDHPLRARPADREFLIAGRASSTSRSRWPS